MGFYVMFGSLNPQFGAKTRNAPIQSIHSSTSHSSPLTSGHFPLPSRSTNLQRNRLQIFKGLGSSENGFHGDDDHPMAGMGYSQAGNHDFHTQFVGGKFRIDDFAMSHHLDKDSYTHFPSPMVFRFVSDSQLRYWKSLRSASAVSLILG